MLSAHRRSPTVSSSLVLGRPRFAAHVAQDRRDSAECEKDFKTDPEHHQPLVVGGHLRLQTVGARPRDEEGLLFADLTPLFPDVR